MGKGDFNKVYIDKTVIIGDGTMIISGTTINIGSKIGRHSIINTSCSIDHDNLIKNCSTVHQALYLQEMLQLMTKFLLVWAQV